MKSLISVVAIITLILFAPVALKAEMVSLSDSEMDSIHAGGLLLFITFNFYLLSEMTPDFFLSPPDINTINQTVGDNNSGSVLLNSIQLNGNAQQNLSALVNFNCVNCVVPFGINITVVHGDNLGSIMQTNNSLGLLNSTLLLGF